MGRLLRGLGVLAGVVLVLWLMRDRFVTVGLPTAQEPVSFRVSPPGHVPPPAPLVSIPGIGPVYAERLAAAGIEDCADLAAAGPHAVAEAAGTSVARAEGWIAAVGGSA